MTDRQFLEQEEPVHLAVARRARLAPEAPAVAEDRLTLSYRELDDCAEQLAARLRAAGAGVGRVVAVLAPRGAAAVAGALAVLKSGAAYLPLDPTQPADRLGRILATAGAHLVVATAEAAGRAPVAADRIVLVGADPRTPAGPVVEPAVPVPTVGPDDTAYLVFTSGSTGEPKGVMVAHRSLANLCHWHRTAFAITAEDRFSAVFSPGFDGAVAEIWPALTAGACLRIADPADVQEPARLRDWLLAGQVSVALFPTPLAEALLPLEWPARCALRVVHAAGDRLRARPAPGLPFRLGNAYGPTENTVWSTGGEVDPVGEGLPDIGRPTAGARVRILDGSLAEAAPGQPGEIHLSGPGLALGYVNRPGLTAERFVPDPLTPGGRMYRTGDLATRQTDGRIAFLGRADRQVKIRGFRIEPGEIEVALRAHPTVADAYVTVQHQEVGDRLVAYVVPNGVREWTSASELRAHVEQRLPEYLRPSAYVALERLPMTVNGKVDAAALPAPRPTRRSPGEAPAAPGTALEKAVLAAWCEVLKTDRLGVHDDFFELGGYSLLAVGIMERLRPVLGASVPVGALFEHPTVARLAAHLEPLANRPDTGAPRTWRHEESRRTPLSLLQEEVWFLAKVAPDSLAYSTQTTLRVRGPLDQDVFDRVLTEVARRHEMLRTTFEEDEDGQAWQLVHDPAPVRADRIDLRELSEPERAQRLRELVAERTALPFDLGRLPLYRWTAFRLADDEYELLLVEHHFVHDGWSYVVLTREITELYAALLPGDPSPLPELAYQYGDFARWQRQAAAGDELADRRAYWLEQLAGAPGVLGLPTDRPRPRRQSYRGGQLRFDLPPALPGLIRDLAREAAATPYMVMLAAFAVLLQRRTGGRDLCVGSGFANRRGETEDLLGMFVNSVVLRCPVPAGASFRAVLGEARRTVLGATAHQDYPFVELVRALRPPRDLGVNPLFQVMFNFHDTPATELALGGSPVTVFEHANGSAKTDLNIIVIPHGVRRVGEDDFLDDRMTVMWEYSSDLFDLDTVRSMADEYVHLLETLIATPDAPLE
ncbi:non-ribosomal peptide synthetase [Kitasatospora mediocidica]|uniref:non-ribosomal peptide synthetase n=1 Tax=Kitasatospora mediocidica TaxID=58352 RepID=UPI000A045614|nr:non-ribosomal peptide synthetase [Kitasatospora mediocidica]